MAYIMRWFLWSIRITGSEKNIIVEALKCGILTFFMIPSCCRKTAGALEGESDVRWLLTQG